MLDNVQRFVHPKYGKCSVISRKFRRGNDLFYVRRLEAEEKSEQSLFITEAEMKRIIKSQNVK